MKNIAEKQLIKKVLLPKLLKIRFSLQIKIKQIDKTFANHDSPPNIKNLLV